MKKQFGKSLQLLSLLGAGVALVGQIVYVLLYGLVQRSMNSMSWSAVWVMCIGLAAAGVLFAVKREKWAAPVLSAAQLVSFFLYIYALYPYISAAVVGIDSTWEAEFFITLALYLVGLGINIAATFRSIKTGSALCKPVALVMSVLCGLSYTGGIIANENAPQINTALNTPNFRAIATGDDSADTEYFKSSYDNLDTLMGAGRVLGEQAMAEGIVLLKNDNNALPLTTAERKVSLFGIGSVDPVYGGTGSGAVDASTAPTFKSAFERDDNFEVNEGLWNWYSSEDQAGYKRVMGETGRGVKGVKVIGEAPWSEVKSANGTSFAAYGDAVVVVISRVGGEGSDMPRGNRSLSSLDDVNGSAGDSTDGNYLKLSPKEIELLKGIKQEKDNGTFKKVIVLLNFANQVEADFLNDSAYGIDAALWIGTPGQTGLYAIPQILNGTVNPSGHLSATFWTTHDKNPSLANFGATAYADVPGAVNSDGSLQQDKYYVVYQEGIYVGYRYTETRYEDFVMGTANTGDYSYADTVAYPFGYGLSYTNFDYSDFTVVKDNSGAEPVYNVSVTVTNGGSVAGKETVQIYLQKPYGSYNRDNSVEAAAAELVGFDKTDLLQPGQSQRVTVTVNERQFASYDAYNAETYVLTEGNYYLTAGRNAHDAVNNFLAKKGYTVENTESRMDQDGNAALVCDAINCAFDAESYSTSAATGAEITNQFSYADFNLYENRGDDSVTYMTRSNWQGTTPKNWDDGVVLHWSSKIEEDENKYGRQGETKVPEVEGEYPAYETFKDGETIGLIALRVDEDGNEIAYNDPLWDTLLDELSWNDYTDVITFGMRRTAKIDAINKPETLDHNGPSGLTEPYSANTRGLASETNDPQKDSRAMCYPSGGILSASFNTDLMYQIGDLIGEDALWAGYNGLYGPGSNIQRTPYSGRNFEYYSEDGFLSGMICAYETSAMESHGLYVYNKHIGLNDQEDLRRGICTWANEQSIREIYMRAFELPITIAGTAYTTPDGEDVTMQGASCVMLAFNRMGLHWSGMQKGLCTNFLRNECGLTGIVVTDMWYGTASPYMNMPQMLLAGANLVDGMMSADHLAASAPGNNHSDVAWAMRESMHRILYTVVHSNAMNGISVNTVIEHVTPWWQTAILALKAISTVGLLASLAWCWKSADKKKKQH